MEIKPFSTFITEGNIKNEVKLLTKKYPDAEVTYKQKSSGKIVYVNGETAYNMDDNSFGSTEKIMFALERAYKAAKGLNEAKLKDGEKIKLGEHITMGLVKEWQTGEEAEEDEYNTIYIEKGTILTVNDDSAEDEESGSDIALDMLKDANIKYKKVK